MQDRNNLIAQLYVEKIRIKVLLVPALHLDTDFSPGRRMRLGIIAWDLLDANRGEIPSETAPVAM